MVNRIQMGIGPRDDSKPAQDEPLQKQLVKPSAPEYEAEKHMLILRETIQHELNQVYYRGLDRKGWPPADEKRALRGIMVLVEKEKLRARIEEAKLPLHGEFGTRHGDHQQRRVRDLQAQLDKSEQEETA